MNFLFWNTVARNLSAQVARLAKERGADVVILAEAGEHARDYLAQLNDGRTGAFFSLAPTFAPASGRLLVLTRLPANEISPAATDHTCSIFHIKPAGKAAFVLACVHLPSPMHMHQDDRTSLAGCTARLIANSEKTAGHERALVIGDFNMNPFEPGMVGSEGFHAVLDRKIVGRGHRTVQSRRRPFYYNPMWRFMNDSRKTSCGTYFYRGSNPLCYFWNTFDQVLIRPDLLYGFEDSNLSLIDSITGESLLDVRGRPNKLQMSDHLPIHLNLSL